MAKYDTVDMQEEMWKAGVPLRIHPKWDAEERYNYIVHMYDAFMIPPAWVVAQETAEHRYNNRRWYNQTWK